MSISIEELREVFSSGDQKRNEGNMTPDDIQRDDNIRYGDDIVWQVLDVYRPKEYNGKLPVIISFHGGAWVYGDKNVYQWYTMSLAQYGFAVINFSYRLAPEYQFPSPIEDMNSVVKWMLENCDTYDFDVNHVFAVGDSAGGNGLGIYCNLLSNPDYAKKFEIDLPKDFAFDAIALNCGAFLIDMDKEGMTKDLMHAYLPHGGSQKELASIDVCKHVTKNFPPCYIMTSDGDFLRQDSVHLFDKLSLVSEHVQYRSYSGQNKPLPHCFHCDIKRKEARQCNQDEIEFFNTYRKE